MERIINELKEAFRRGSIHIQLIYINAGVFLLSAITSVFFLLFNRSTEGISRLFELPSSIDRLITQPWSLFTYMFMHADILHILFNMLWLYWFGAMFLYSFSAKHLRGLYILGGLCGGILYIISYNVFPYFSDSVQVSTMVGASASILAIVIATAYREPNYPVRLFLFGSIKMKYIAAIVILMDLLFLTSGNAGGHIAHLGGALAGFWFATGLEKGKDFTAWINRFLDWITSLFDKKTWKRKKKPKMKVYYSDKAKDYDYNANKKAQSDEIDRILDKLKKSGYNSLTTEEKKSLFDASKR